MLNLDTHILLHAVGGSLRPAEARLLTSNRWSISAIVLWEIAKLAQLGRVAIELDDPEVVRVLARVHVCPICGPLDRTLFKNYSDQYPDGPPAHPNCRCDIGVEVAGADDALI